MNFGFSAGVLSRRLGFGPLEWRARVRLLFGRRTYHPVPRTVDPDKIADAWVAEFGDAATWSAERKIGELVEWGDHDGARVWTDVLNVIQERDRVRKSSGA
jgi:hypothetical protein